MTPDHVTLTTTTALGLLWMLVAEFLTVTTKEYCQLENFDASCPDGAVILMQHAEYGRMNLGRCLTRDYYVGCVADVITQMDRKCSGRRQCHVPVPEHSLLRALACPTDLVAYLDADYTCITGETASSSTCTSQHYVTVTQPQLGYLLSDISQTTGVGTERCPWLVVVRRGQRIRITLYDLATAPSAWSGERQASQTNDGRCLLYATLREGLEADGVGDHMVCSGTGTREQVVYTSRDHTLAVTVHYAPASRFILQYEAVGCPDIDMPAHLGAHVVRNDDTADVICNSSVTSLQHPVTSHHRRHRHRSQQQQLQQSWRLVCHGTQWLGDYGNCTRRSDDNELQLQRQKHVDSTEHVLQRDGSVSASGDEEHQPLTSLSYGLWFAVTAGLFLGITIGFSLLLIVCLRRTTSKHSSSSTAEFAQLPTTKLSALQQPCCLDDLLEHGISAAATGNDVISPHACALYACRLDPEVVCPQQQRMRGSDFLGDSDLAV